MHIFAQEPIGILACPLQTPDSSDDREVREYPYTREYAVSSALSRIQKILFTKYNDYEEKSKHERTNIFLTRHMDHRIIKIACLE
jgi:hypothetical protein